MTINHLVLSGGGIRGILKMCGTVYRAEAEGKWSIENLKTIWATSAGTFVAVIVALQLPWEELENYFVHRPWDKIIKIEDMDFSKIFTSCGILDDSLIKEAFRPLFAAADVDLTVTFKDFFKKTGIELHFFCVELNKFECVDMSHLTHPELQVIDAVYRSCCIPIVFCPKITENGEIYVDGGLLKNYPARTCLERTGGDIETIYGIHCQAQAKNVENIVDFLQKLILNAFVKLNGEPVHLIHEEIITNDVSTNMVEQHYMLFSFPEQRRSLLHGEV